MAKASLAFDWSSLTPIDANISPSSTRNINSTMPASNYMFKVNNRNTRTRCEICSKLTIKTPERR